jgi:hypothetical protein
LPTPAEAVAARARTDTAPPAASTIPLAMTRAARDDSGSHPIYKKWWFWVGVGVVAAGASTAAVMAGSDTPPSSDLGNFPVF